jgi:hypothetical protein
MKKSLGIIFALVTLFAVVPNALALTKAFQVNTASGGTLTTGLVSYWNMEGNSNDYWGTNNGTDTSVSYGTSYGKVSQGASFNGSTSNIRINTAATFSNVSVALWFKMTSTGIGELFNIADSSNNANFDIDVNNNSAGKLEFGTWNGSTAYSIYSSGSSYDDGNWHLVIAVKAGTTLTLYADNVFIGTITQSAFNVGGTYWGIGWNVCNESGFYSGYIDEVGIWSKAPSTQEMTDLWNGGAGQTMCNGTGGPLCSIPRRHQIVLNPFEAKFEHFIFA